MWLLYKILFLMSTSMGTLMAISSYSWMGMWMGLEINLLSIIPLMNNSKNIYSSESSLKYFITQALASMVLLFSMAALMSENLISMDNLKQAPTLILNSSLMMKMGAAPFHFWFPEIMEGLTWMNSALMLTWQKIAPMTILMYNIKSTTMIMIIIATSMAVGGLMGINQTSLRKILTYSSINHMGWMLAAMLKSESIWMIYFILYTIINMSMIMMFKALNIFYMKQLMMTMKNNSMLKMSMTMNFLSLGGLPPFLGFLPKWMTINFMVQENITMAIFMVMMTMITLYYYIRTLLPSMTISTQEISFSKKSYLMSINLIMNSVNIMMLITCTMWFNFL